MSAKGDNHLNRARGPDSHSFYLTTAILIVIALLAGLVYWAGPAGAVATIHILDDENGGMCRDMGWTWDPATKTCTMNDNLNVDGIDAIHIESDGITLVGAGHVITGSGAFNGVTVNGMRDVTVRDLELSGFSIGIYIRDSRGTSVTGLNAHGNSFGGYVSGASSGNDILHSSLATNGYGIVIVNGPQETLVISNDISSNSYGVQLGGSGTAGNTILGNDIHHNTAYGLTIESGGSDNSIYNNVFNANATHAGVFGGTGNSFNQPAPIGGNWWSGWTSPDVNGDGFVDNPYVFTGGQDNYPFTEQFGWDDTAPVISNVQPSGAIHTGAFTVTADYLDSDPSGGINLASASAHFTSGPSPPNLNCVANGSPAGTITCTPDANLNWSAPYTYEISLADNLGNIATASQTFNLAPYTIRDDATGGDCDLIGTWDAVAKTCTLDTDLSIAALDGIRVEGNGITLDGAGHTVTSTAPAVGTQNYGVNLSAGTGKTVRNVQVVAFDNSIVLNACTDCSLLGNTSLNNDNGLIVQNSVGARIDGNTSSGNGAGTILYYSDGVTVAGNQLSNNGSGLWMIASNECTISGNTAMANIGTGFILSYDSSNNVLINNRADTNSTGIAVNPGANNTIRGNLIIGNSMYGLYFGDGATGNQAYNNNITNSHFSLYFEAATTGNWIYHNNFVLNSMPPQDRAGGNYFSGGEPMGGNHWSNWTSPDANGDGFVDNPYVIGGEGGSQDSYPYVNQYGWDQVGPVVSNIQPSGWINSTSTTISADYADVGSEINVASVTVGIDGVGLSPSECTANSTSVGCTKSGLTLGQHSILVSVSDMAGHTGTGTGSFGVDSEPFHIESPFIEKWNALGGAPGLASDVAVTIGGGKYQEFSDGILIWNESTGLVYWVHGAIQAKYDEYGGLTGVFGLPVSDEMNVAGVVEARESDFTGGRIYWGSGVGTFGVVSGPIMTKFLAGGGTATYGIPTGDEYAVGGGTAQDMQRATLTWDGDSGHPAYAVVGGILAKYKAMGGPAGTLSLAISDEMDVAGVAGARESDFTGGRIYWGPVVGTYGVTSGPIMTKFLAGGGTATYGIPTSDKYVAGGGEAQNIQKATLTWDGTGNPAYAVVGGILAKYKAFGGPNGTLGLATGDEGDVSGVPGARESNFTSGRIYWGPGIGTFAMSDMNILTHFDSNGGASYLGLPISDVYSAWDGKAQNMQKSIFTWNTRNGAHFVRGGVMVKYQMTGGPPGYLHLIMSEEAPLSPALPTHPEAVQAIFENGRVYWSLTTGSHIVNGGVYVTYMGYCDATGCGPSSRLGLPITDEYPLALPGGGARSRFEHGFISWWIYYGSWVDVT